MSAAIAHTHFADLPAKVQQRLRSDIEAMAQGRGGAVVFSVGAQGAKDDSGRNRSVLGALALLALLVAMLVIDFGSTVQPVNAGLVMAALVAGALWLVLRVIPMHQKAQAGLAPGAYVFASDIVDTRNGRFRVFPLRGLQQFTGTDFTNGGKYLFTRLDFTLANGQMMQLQIQGQELARRCMAALQQRMQQLQAATQAGQVEAVAALDPFDEMRRNGLGVDASVLRVNRIKRSALAWALGIGLPVGLAAWAVRNLASDHLFFKTAMAGNTEQALQSYIGQGWRYVDEARAALPGAALSDARKAGSVTALRSVLVRYPAAGLKPEVDKEVHAVFMQAFDRFKALATRTDRTVEPFVRELLGYLESSGESGVIVSFIRPSTQALEQVDKRKSAMAPVARHFGDANAGRRELRMTRELANGFKMVFPQDVLALVSTHKAGRPVLQVNYEIAPSGQVYRSELTGGQFVGVVVKFDVTFSLPGSATVWRSKLQVLPPDRFQVKGQSPSDADIYAEMADRAFDQLSAQLNGAFFKPERR